MLIELEPMTTSLAKQQLIGQLEKMGFQVMSLSQNRLALVQGVDALVDKKAFEALPGVQKVTSLQKKYKLASRESQSEDTLVDCKGITLGGSALFVIAGPCSIESEEQLEACAKAAQASGAQALRGGAFKPRTSPYEFQGMGEKGLQLLSSVARRYGLITVSEVMDSSQIDLMMPYVDIFQVGARNMQNFSLLKELGKLRKPILLKRGFSATYQDLLMAAEYILSGGNREVILCERGIRTFETHTRNTLDLNAVPVLKELTHLPILVDPSHGTGIRSLVKPMARAALAAGAHGLIIETHPEPEKSISDSQQTLNLEEFAEMMRELNIVHEAMQRICSL